jgi:fatty-acyl-CoA synthase
MQSDSFVSRAWLRALELTTPIAKHRQRTLPVVIEEAGTQFGEAPALLSETQHLTYRQLAERVNQYARWALRQGLATGDVVCLLMSNQPEYMAIWLGITSVGVVVALLNTNLGGHSLAHCIREVSPKCIIATAEHIDRLTAALSLVETSPAVWAYQADKTPFARIDLEISSFSRERLTPAERRQTSIDDRALFIYTSGTTGMPKAANVSHGRVMQWSHWFAGMMQAGPSDRMYSCLPMYHSIGGVQAPGSLLVAGGSVVIRERFSASQFWNDIRLWDCTLFQYIGELCRYLLCAAPSMNETEHRIRLACGNGLAPQIWDAFKDRFQIPRILEFYAATEGTVSLFNVRGRSGSIGHIPPYLAHRFTPALVLLDEERNEPVRDENGFCIRCAPNQPGEAIGKVMRDPSNIVSRFEGYRNQEASEKKILRDVFERGDTWIRTGDLMRRDERGYFYFVDRIGDTFRRKGENVASSEVSEAICAFPGVKHANVYGVPVPGIEGRVGMAALVIEKDLDLGDLRQHLASRLPTYARPIFLRIRVGLDLTGTFKYSKIDLLRQGYDPVASKDPLYFDHPESGAFVRIDKRLFERIKCGEIRI